MGMTSWACHTCRAPLESKPAGQHICHGTTTSDKLSINNSMKTRLILPIVAIALIGSTSLCSAAPSIKDVMKAAMKGDDSLFKKVSTGKGTDADTAKLYNCLKNMAGQKAPKGDQAAYDSKTDTLIKAAEAVSKGGKDFQALSQAGNCKACHTDHKGK